METICKIANALGNIGISITDSKGECKEVDDILEEMANVFQKLEKDAITEEQIKNVAYIKYHTIQSMVEIRKSAKLYSSIKKHYKNK